MNKPLIIISRNPDSYLAGHSIFAWQLSEFLGGHIGVPVIHITHAADEGLCHNVRITPPVTNPCYKRIEVRYQSMKKVPHSLSSCVVADTVDAVLQEHRQRVGGVLAISPLSYLPDVLNVCLTSSTPIVGLLRGTDTLELNGPWGTTHSGLRYRRALGSCNAIFTVSRWLENLAHSIGLSVTGVVTPVTFHPFSKETLELETRSLEQEMFSSNAPLEGRLISFAGRMAEEKGALKVAQILNRLLKKDRSLMAVMAGSGPERQRIDEVMQPHIREGRAWVGPLSFRRVLALALKTDLMIMGSGLEDNENFTEAISSSSVTFASTGTPVLYCSGSGSGGIAEAVGEENRRWCESLSGHCSWPQDILDLFQNKSLYEQITCQNRVSSKAFEIEAVLSKLLTYFKIRLPN